MKFPCRKLVGASVIVLMALSAVAPLGYTHAHEATVCHEHNHAPAKTHSHTHCHRHCQAAGEKLAQPVMLAPHAHQHVLWWGLEFVLPSLPVDDSGKPATDFDGTQLSALHASTSKATVDAAAPLGLLLATIDFAAPSSATPQPVAARAAPRTENNLLCDAARHERSGVQRL